MAYYVIDNIESCKVQLATLVETYKNEISSFRATKYSEAQLRIDFLNPLLKCFGWDVDNEFKKSQFTRDVIQEELILVEEKNVITKKKPDYTLRQFGNRCLFLEAKKVSIDIINSEVSAFQLRRYGWNANLGVSVLSNFENLVFYDCRLKPNHFDKPSISRYRIFHYSEFLDQIDELYSLLSFESIQNGCLDTLFSKDLKVSESFDDYFLAQIDSWRCSLATNLVMNNDSLDQLEINFLIQRLINRILFLRICEDKEFEKYETLKSISSYDELKSLFKKSDAKYNSGLFSFIDDNLSEKIKLNDSVLIKIFAELYYPISSYDFSVVSPSLLSQIYERYLGNSVELSSDYSVSIVSHPEVVASNGVVPTPDRIVKQIIKETLDPTFQSSSYSDICNLKLCDICCGSGTFLIASFDYLIKYREDYFIANSTKDDSKLIKTGVNQYRLSLHEKHEILQDNIFGVDINPYAVEVTQFSLLLKLIEQESNVSIEAFIKSTSSCVLPELKNNVKCGNSLLDNSYLSFDETVGDDELLLFKLNPFCWIDEFPFLEKTKGFDILLGNPPYVRIQNFIKYSLEEVEYYRSKYSPYSVTKKDIFDKYYLFIEKAIDLLAEGGRLGYIVPHKFFIATGGAKLRKAITSQVSVERIIHFGVTQVFPQRTTYTAIIVLTKETISSLSFSRIDDLTHLNVFETTSVIKYQNNSFGAGPWVFVSQPAEELFKRVGSVDTVPLNTIAEIPVGLQTSQDKTYIFKPIRQDESFFYFKKMNVFYKVEKAICKPCLYDASFGLFDRLISNTQIIFPYIVSQTTATVIPEEIMETEFPFCWSYLNRHKEDLQKRSFNGNNPKWYQFGRSQSLTKFHATEKIIFPVLSTKPSYALDKANLQFTGGGNGPYYSILSKSKYSLYYLMGILSHPVIEAMVKSRASEFKGEYYSHGKQFIADLPIKAIDFDDVSQKKAYDRIVFLVTKLIETRERIKALGDIDRRNILSRQLKRLNLSLLRTINSLYGFSKEDLICITGSNLFIVSIEE